MRQALEGLATVLAFRIARANDDHVGTPVARYRPHQFARHFVTALRQVDTLVRAGMPRPFAASLAELIACIASDRVSPRGDRGVTGTTRLEDILPGLVARAIRKNGTILAGA